MTRSVTREIAIKFITSRKYSFYVFTSSSTTQGLSAQNEIEGLKEIKDWRDLRKKIDQRYLSDLVICTEFLRRAAERSGGTEWRKRVVSRAEHEKRC